MESKRTYKLEQFEGPLDLLLFLIRKNEVNIYDIPISLITEQYIAYLEEADKENLENLSEFYVTASTLLYIKSRMLLPVEVNIDEEVEDPRQDLVAKLIDYQKYRKISDMMKNRIGKKELKADTIRPRRKILYKEDIWEEVSAEDLLTCYRSVRNIADLEKVVNLDEEVTINEKISLINEILDNKDDFSFEELITRPDSLMDVVCAFLAILDCVKNGLIGIFQSRQYGDIKIKRIEGALFDL